MGQTDQRGLSQEAKFVKLSEEVNHLDIGCLDNGSSEEV